MIILGILQALIYLPVNLFVTLIAWILAPILPLFASDDGWLPKYLWWFQTPDNSIDGDNAFNTPSKHPYITKMPRYWRRVFWLIRNPSYGFNWTVLATKPYKYYGDLFAKDKVGWCFSWIVDTKYFHFVSTLFGKYLKFRIGWNLANSLIDKTYKGNIIKYCFTCNPFKSAQK